MRAGRRAVARAVHGIALAVLALPAACRSVAPTPDTATSADAAPPADVARFLRTVDSLRVAHRIPGLSVAVVRDGRVVAARGFGVADVERGTPATATTPYDIASVTKPIAGVVALRLVERGVLDLDRPMTAYDGFASLCADVRAGGPPLFFRDWACDTEPMTLRHVLGMTSNGAVGTRFFYNPMAFSWASRPMMQATGRAFSDLVAEEVFAPAEMTRSARVHRALPLRADLAADLAPPHRVDSAGRIVRAPPRPAQGDGAAGGVISTVLDLARFDVALDEGRLLSDASRRTLWTAGRTPAGAALPYGVGWYVQEHEGRQLLWHSGWWEEAYSALYLKVPDRRLTVILLANSEGLWWDNPLDAAAVHRSPFAAAFLREVADFAAAPSR